MEVQLHIVGAVLGGPDRGDARGANIARGDHLAVCAYDLVGELHLAVVLRRGRQIREGLVPPHGYAVAAVRFELSVGRPRIGIGSGVPGFGSKNMEVSGGMQLNSVDRQLDD